FIGCIAAYFLSYNVIVRKVGFFGGMTFCLLSLIFVVLSLYSASSYEDNEYCVVIEKKCPIYKSIEIEDDNILIEVVGGTELKLEKEEDESPQGLVKVRLNKSVQGWVKKGEVEVL
ncbi:MAG: hypothetical protein K2N03_07755, partial [Muribaculaceae bacterium]|nr:hypothetical protein [Muribaculaceae bacterium]